MRSSPPSCGKSVVLPWRPASEPAIQFGPSSEASLCPCLSLRTCRGASRSIVPLLSSLTRSTIPTRIRHSCDLCTNVYRVKSRTQLCSFIINWLLRFSCSGLCRITKHCRRLLQSCRRYLTRNLWKCLHGPIGVRESVEAGPGQQGNGYAGGVRCQISPGKIPVWQLRLHQFNGEPKG